MIKLTDKIKQERENYNLTQFELADKVDLSRSTIQRMEETDNHNWQLKSVLKICKFFGWNVEALVEEDNTIYFDDKIRSLTETDISESFTFGYNQGYEQGKEDTKLRFNYKEIEEHGRIISIGNKGGYDK